MTRWTLGLFAVTLLTLCAQAQDKPEDAIKRAIKEVGGEESLKKFPAGVSQLKGKMFVGGMELPFTGSMVFSTPGKVKMELAVEVGGQKVAMTQVVNGNAVKQTENSKSIDILPSAKAELLQAAHLQEIALLYPLLDPTKYTLKPGTNTNDHAVVLVEGKDNGLKPISLFFSKKTGLLDKMTRKGLNPNGAAVDEETAYSEYKNAGGLLIPMVSKVSHDGKLFLDIIVTEFKPLEKTDEKFDTGN